MDDPAKGLFEKGLAWLKRGEMLTALSFFERSFGLDPSNSACLSYMALLVGLERGRVRKAITMAEEAVSRSPEIPALHVNLGRLYNRAGKNEEALQAVRKSLKNGRMLPEAIALLNEINPRMKPLFSFLPRGHLINRWAGKILKKTGFRRFRMPGQGRHK